MVNKVCAYQIFYDAETFAHRDPGFEVLDNMSNRRPDWREYWPIRNFLLTNENLEEDAYYGFLSPKFREKTGLSAQDVYDFLERGSPSVDVFSFSPFFDQAAMFENIFEQGEIHHPGLIKSSMDFMSALGLDASLVSRIGHSRNTIYCNYFFAKPDFWRHWLKINEVLFAHCEVNTTAWARSFNEGTKHASGSCPLKVFLVERVASLLLATGDYHCMAYKPADLPRTNSKAGMLGEELVIADALKQAFVATGDKHYLHAFYIYRAAVMKKIAA